jgi:hypothetical protein
MNCLKAFVILTMGIGDMSGQAFLVRWQHHGEVMSSPIKQERLLKLTQRSPGGGNLSCDSIGHKTVGFLRLDCLNFADYLKLLLTISLACDNNY